MTNRPLVISLSPALTVIKAPKDLPIDELSSVSQNIDNSLIKVKELCILHLELKASVNTSQHLDDIPASLVEALDVRISMTNA